MEYESTEKIQMLRETLSNIDLAITPPTRVDGKDRNC